MTFVRFSIGSLIYGHFSDPMVTSIKGNPLLQQLNIYIYSVSVVLKFLMTSIRPKENPKSVLNRDGDT